MAELCLFADITKNPVLIRPHRFEIKINTLITRKMFACDWAEDNKLTDEWVILCCQLQDLIDIRDRFVRDRVIVRF